MKKKVTITIDSKALDLVKELGENSDRSISWVINHMIKNELNRLEADILPIKPEKGGSKDDK